jgi:hypothetical protein
MELEGAAMGVVRDRSVLIACIGAGSAIVAAFAKPICDTLFAERPVKPAVITTGDAAHSVTATPGGKNAPGIEGAWKQYVLTEDEGVVYMSTFVVATGDEGYVISPRKQVEGERFQTSLGVFDIAYDGAHWSYNSNWGDGEVGNFELERVSPTVFEGDIRLAGKLLRRTRLVKVE